MRIVKILSVKDTREYVEQGDRWVAIPGSGQEHTCSRCGRAHEVHAEVELEDGAVAVVGTGCANQADLEKEMKLRTSRAKRLARLQAERMHLINLVTRKAGVDLEVAALLPPLDTIKRSETEHPWGRRWHLHMDGIRQSSPTEPDSETVKQLVYSWRQRQRELRGMTFAIDHANQDLAEVEHKIEKLLIA